MHSVRIATAAASKASTESGPRVRSYVEAVRREFAGATIASGGNKRLALIGDAALRLVLYEFGYEDEASIRDMTNAQNTLATNENLARIRFSVGMDAYIQLNPSAQGVVPGRLMATTIEAIIGAVYLDRNRNTMDIRLLVIHLRIMPTLQ
ncbi:hypothetical protein N7499_001802 [Penicillium canescens]|nr:hypothetical protein N7499_001802 [Penicillium canescens]KAJ6165416.1 hypothetical protein N7485_008660 [Penicillium canescens]